ncbi:MAG: hypothetical protein ACYTF3_05345 [Planctomycetota bacterium]|jgi:protocatechuate 3,4-dioxygenase beta subunit
MSERPHRLARAAPRRGGVSLTGLVLGGAAVLLVVLAWITFSGDPVAPPEPVEPPVVEEPVVEGPGPATLEIPLGGPLPGLGPLEVSLHYLGDGDDARLRPSYPGRLEGMVYGPQGKGLVDAKLSLVGGPQDGLTVLTDEQGRYLFPEILPGTHFIRLSSAVTADTARIQRVLSRAGTRRDFFLGATLTVQLRVRDHEGKALPGAVLGFDFGTRRFTTDEEGVALVEGVSGGRRVVVDVEGAGHVPVRYELNLFPRMQDGEVVDLPPLPQAGRLRGKVVSWPGGERPTVTLVPRGTSIEPYLYQWERWQGVPVDREGAFVFEDLPTTTLLDVRIGHSWGPSQPQARSVKPGIAAAATVEFVVREDPKQVRGTVQDETGAALRGAALTLTAAEPMQVLQALYPGLVDSPLGVRLPQPAVLRRTTTSDGEGAFRFALGDHPQGTGRLLLTATGRDRRAVRREVRTVGQSFRLTLAPAPPPASLGLTRTDDGPIPPATTWLLEGEAVDAGAGGALEGLAPGSYHVVVRRGDLELLRLEDFRVEGRAALDLARF